MGFLIIIGALTSLLGLFGLGYCIWQGFRMRRAGQDLKTITPQLQKLIAINFASVALSALGLMTIVIGILL
jgi:hypothetical protein